MLVEAWCGLAGWLPLCCGLRLANRSGTGPGPDHHRCSVPGSPRVETTRLLLRNELYDHDEDLYDVVINQFELEEAARMTRMEVELSERH